MFKYAYYAFRKEKKRKKNREIRSDLLLREKKKKKEKKEEMGVLTQDLNLNKSTEIHEEKIFTGRNTNLETE